MLVVPLGDFHKFYFLQGMSRISSYPENFQIAVEYADDFWKAYHTLETMQFHPSFTTLT